MWRVTWKGLLAHKVRLALTAVAVVLGVAFVAGTFVLTDSLSASFEGLFADINEGVDAYVNPASTFDPSFVNSGGPIPEAGTIPEEYVEDVQAVEGVDAAEGYVQGLTIILTEEGDPIGGNGPPQLGLSVAEDPIDSSISLREGRFPQGPDEVTIDVASAETGGYELGDEVQLVTDAGRMSATVVGLTGFGDEDNLLGATIVGLELETARDVFDKPGVFDQIVVQGADDLTPDELVERLSAALPDDVEAVTAASEQEEQLAAVQGFLGFFNNILLAFGAVALFVGAFIIANTFSIVVTQRTREFALLRALGASSKQVTRSVLTEAFLVGLISSVLGLLLGIGLASGLRAVLGAFGLGFPEGGNVVAVRTVVVALAIGMILTVVSALLPARRAARVAPVEAMRGTGAADEGSSRVRTLSGAVATAAGAAALLIGLLASVDNALSLVGGGAALLMLGVAMLAPLVAGPVTGLVGRLIARRGVTGKLARENARRNPKRTATTAAALMIGLALVSFVTILAATVTTSINTLLDEQFRADFIVSASTQGPPTPMPSSIADQLAEAPELGAVSGLRYGPALVDGDQWSIIGADTERLDELVELDLASGDVTSLGAGGFFASEGLAESRGWEVGDVLPFAFVAGGETDLTLEGIYTAGDLIGAPVMVADETWSEFFTQQGDSVIYVDAAEGVDVEEARAIVEEIASQAPIVSVQDQASFREEQDAAIGQLLNLMLVLLAFAVVIALIGITNTMALSVFERTRELGLLRAVGMTGRQVRRMVRGESALVASFGGILGVVVGSFFGWAVVQALEEDGLNQLTIPVGRLLVYLVVAALAGIVAGSFPANRAAKLDVLEAVTTE